MSLCVLVGGVFFIVRQPNEENPVVKNANENSKSNSQKTPIEEVKEEWLKHESADIQLVLKVAEIQGYDTLKGKLTYSAGAKCYLLTESGNMPLRHLPFELIDKLKTSSKSKEIADIIGAPFQDVNYYSEIDKSIVFIGEKNKYSIRANSQTRVLLFAVLSDIYASITDYRVLSSSTNSDLFNSADIKYLYKVLGYPLETSAPKPKVEKPNPPSKPKDPNANK